MEEGQEKSGARAQSPASLAGEQHADVEMQLADQSLDHKVGTKPYRRKAVKKYERRKNIAKKYEEWQYMGWGIAGWRQWFIEMEEIWTGDQTLPPGLTHFGFSDWELEKQYRDHVLRTLLDKYRVPLMFGVMVIGCLQAMTFVSMLGYWLMLGGELHGLSFRKLVHNGAEAVCMIPMFYFLYYPWSRTTKFNIARGYVVVTSFGFCAVSSKFAYPATSQDSILFESSMGILLWHIGMLSVRKYCTVMSMVLHVPPVLKFCLPDLYPNRDLLDLFIYCCVLNVIGLWLALKLSFHRRYHWYRHERQHELATIEEDDEAIYEDEDGSDDELH